MKSSPSTVAGAAELDFRVDANGATHVYVDGADTFKLDTYYRFEDRRLEDAFGASIRSDLADLSAVAMAVYISDRLIRRPSHSDRATFAWTRRLHLRIPLWNPERWALLADSLADLLWWCTEDQWTFEFLPRPPQTIGPEHSVQRLLIAAVEPPVRTALFSGGLDSLAGLCDAIAQEPRGSIVLMCATTHSRLTNRQQQLAKQVAQRTGVRLVPVVVPFGFRRQGRSYNADEPTQRTRGFVFMALGAVAAHLAGCRELNVYENGVGIVNLPYTDAQLGTNTSRSVHPRTMAGLEQLVQAVTEMPFAIEPTALWRTKGQLNGAISRLGLSDLVALTVSCDGFPQRRSGTPVCGVCPSCLLRRQSLHASGLLAHDNPAAYRWDILNPHVRIGSKHLYPWRAMHDQVARLEAALAGDNPWQGLTRLYPQFADLAERPTAVTRSTEDPRGALVTLYRQYVAEWRAFPAQPVASERQRVTR